MTELTEAERHLLSAAAETPEGEVRLCFRLRGAPVSGAEAVLALADSLVDRWMLTHQGNDGGRSDPFEPVWALYRLTSYGRVVAEMASGELALDGDDLDHPGCC